MGFRDYGMSEHPFTKLERAFDNYGHSLGLVTKGKSYMSEEKRIKARKKRKKKQK